MVTVGDVELAVGKVIYKLRYNRLVGAYPQAVGDVVVVGEFVLSVKVGLLVDGFQGGVFAVHVKRVNLAEIAVGRLHKVEAVGLCLRQSELVRQDDALRKFLDLDARDHSLDASALVVGVEFHLVNVDRGLILVDQNAL